MTGLIAAAIFSHASASQVFVSSMLDLQSAVNNSSPGDTIVLMNGTYTNGTLVISRSGIMVKAEKSGGVFLNGSQNIDITGNDVVFSGFQFTSGDIGDAYLIQIYGSRNTVTQLNFNGYFAKKYIQIDAGSQYNLITYCNIENKPAAAVSGCTIQINTSPAVPGYHRIRYCSFKNFPGAGGDYGNEPIRIGLSTEMTNVSRSIVEYCYFNNVGLGDGESISLKSSENICRFNTFTNNPKGMLVFRHGYRNIAYGNFFINGSGGIRIKEGADHYVYNNYFETGSADALIFQYVPEYPLSNINIIHNTFVNSGKIDLGGTGPNNVTVANNIFSKATGSIFTNPNNQTTWIGNIYNGILGMTIPSGFVNAEPQFLSGASGYKILSSASPAVNAAQSGYPAILDIANIDDDPGIMMDFEGQARPLTVSLKDIGCDEYTSGAITNRPLSVSDVGPDYVRVMLAVERTDPLVASPAGDPSRYHLYDCYPNPFNPSTSIRFSVPSSRRVKLKIINAAGQEIGILYNGVAEPGREYEVRFDASTMSSGVFLSQLEYEGTFQRKKMLHLK